MSGPPGSPSRRRPTPRPASRSARAACPHPSLASSTSGCIRESRPRRCTTTPTPTSPCSRPCTPSASGPTGRSASRKWPSNPELQRPQRSRSVVAKTRGSAWLLKETRALGSDQPLVEDRVDIVPGAAQPLSDKVKVLVELELQPGSTVTPWNLLSSAVSDMVSAGAQDPGRRVGQGDPRAEPRPHRAGASAVNRTPPARWRGSPRGRFCSPHTLLFEPRETAGSHDRARQGDGMEASGRNVGRRFRAVGGEASGRTVVQW
jgi:hypothetical protein